MRIHSNHELKAQGEARLKWYEAQSAEDEPSPDAPDTANGPSTGRPAEIRLPTSENRNPISERRQERGLETVTLAGPYRWADGGRLRGILPLPIEPIGNVAFDRGRTDRPGPAPSVADAKEQLGWAVSLGTVGYAMGKFAAGSLVDLLGGRRNYLIGMAGAVACTMLFALGGSIPVFTLVWFVNRLIQSLGWPGMIKITSRWFSHSRYGTVMGVISLSFLFGDALARAFMGRLDRSWAGLAGRLLGRGRGVGGVCGSSTSS